MKVLWTGLLMCGAIYSGSAWADCVMSTRFVTHEVHQVRDVMVDSTVPAGTPLGREGNVVVPAGQWRFNCAINSTPTPVRIDSIAPQFVNGVYQFTVSGKPSGVGLRLFVSENGGPRQQFPFTRSRVVPNDNSWSEAAIYYTTLEKVGGAAVVYGPVDIPSGGTIAQSSLVNENPGAGINPGPYTYTTITLGYFNLVRPSCTMDTASLNQTVPLGDYNVSEFANSKPSGWVPFNLKVANCADPTILADITFGTTADAIVGYNDLFSMNKDGPQGLGIAIATADPSPKAMLPGQTQTFPNPGTGNNFPFQARLQPTAGQVTAGTVNRPVTVLVNFK